VGQGSDCIKYVTVTQVSAVKYSPSLGRSATSRDKFWKQAKRDKNRSETLAMYYGGIYDKVHTLTVVYRC
jgi:hypothetical protein